MQDGLGSSRQALLQQRREAGEEVHDEDLALLPENEDAAWIYLMTRNQCLVTMDGQAIDLDLRAVKAAMDVYGVQDQATCMTRVVRTWRAMEAKRREG